MSARQSGWSTIPQAATAANAVPIGGSVKVESPLMHPIADKLESASDFNLSVGLFGTTPLDASSKHARKVYIGNLPPSATSEQIITQFFNQTLAVLLPNKPPGDSIVSTYLNAPKRFAFIENRSIEETTFTLGLDGIQMNEYALKLRRPQDYNAQLAQQQLSTEMRLKGGMSSLRGAWNPMQQASAGESSSYAQTQSGPGIVSTSVEDGPNKVFIGGLPHHMGEQEVKELLASYGPLRAFHLVKDRELDRSKGFAFCEWRDPSITDIACQSLNGMKIGDRFLNVRRAIPHSAHRTGSLQGMLTTSGGGGSGSDLMAGGQLALSYFPLAESRVIPPQQKGVPPLVLPEIATCLKHESTQGSRCLAVRRVVPTDREIDAEEVQRLVEEVKARASQVGKVRNAMFHHSGGGRILVELSTPEEASAAQKLFDGRELCGTKADCALTELISEMRKTCLHRVTAEADMLARLEPGARDMYLDRERKLVEANRLRRERLLADMQNPSSAP